MESPQKSEQINDQTNESDLGKTDNRNEPNDESLKESNDKNDTSNVQPTKRRKTGWDREQREPITVPKSSVSPLTNTFSSQPIPVSRPAPPNLPPPPLTVPNPSAQAQQTAQEIAAKLALQQQLLAKTSLVNLLPQITKPGCRIYVGSLHYDLQEADVIALFSAFGKVMKCDMTRDSSTGRSKGFCFVEFNDPSSAEAAMSMNGFDVAGRKIKVGRPIQGSSATVASLTAFQPALTGINQVPALSLSPPTTIPPPPSGAPPTNFVAVYNVGNNIGLAEVQDLFTLYGSMKTVKRITATKLDPASYYDILFEYNDPGAAAAAARTMNGHNIAGSRIIVETISLQGAIQLMIQKVEQAVLTTVLLEDMITVEDTKDPDLEGEIREEADKYGSIITLKISVEGGKATIKLHYQEASQAVKAQKALNGRSFAGRRIKASLVP